MAILDERGRVFGKINLIDLGLILVVAVLIPLAYGAYLLFRTPPPLVTVITPNSIAFQKGVEQRLKVTGEHLRPFLRAFLNDKAARSFLVATPAAGELVFTDFPPGTYDLVLFDEAQEVAKLPKALTIVPPPPESLPPQATIQALGMFVGPSGTLGGLSEGQRLGKPERPQAEILNIEGPETWLRKVQFSGGGSVFAPVVTSESRKAAVRLYCDFDGEACTIGGRPVTLMSGASLWLFLGETTFIADEIRGDSQQTVTVKARFDTYPEVISLMKRGDIDRDAGAGPARGAMVLSVTDGQTVAGTFGQSTSVSASDASISMSAQLREQLLQRIAEVRVPVETVAGGGLRYRGVPIRAGGFLIFETPRYSVRGLVLSVSPTKDPGGHE